MKNEWGGGVGGAVYYHFYTFFNITSYEGNYWLDPPPKYLCHPPCTLFLGASQDVSENKNILNYPVMILTRREKGRTSIKFLGKKLDVSTKILQWYSNKKQVTVPEFFHILNIFSF